MPPETAVAVADAPQTPAIRRPAVDALKEIESVVLQGNLKTLPEAQRIAYYARVCESLGLNPLTRPFEYIELQGKLTLYARKDATDQLRDLHGVTIDRLERERDTDAGLQIVTAYARDKYGRTDSAIGAVSIKGLSGEALANALMKAETKAKRRVTLSICGLGWMDEIEALDARAVEVAPRSAATSAIRSRTAALTGGTVSGESEAASIGSQAAAAEVHGSPPAAGSPTPEEQAATPEAKPRARSRKKAEAKKAGDDGYWRARAHAVADERGLDPEALKRVAGDVLGKEGDWSRTELDEQAWEYLAGVVDAAPTRDESEEAWLANATVFAGNQAIAAGIASKLESDADWAPVEESAAEMFRMPVDDITPAGWSEYGLRIAALGSAS